MSALGTLLRSAAALPGDVFGLLMDVTAIRARIYVLTRMADQVASELAQVRREVTRLQEEQVNLRQPSEPRN